MDSFTHMELVYKIRFLRARQLTAYYEGVMKCVRVCVY